MSHSRGTGGRIAPSTWSHFCCCGPTWAFLLARGGGSDTSHDRCRGGSLGRHVGPRGAHTRTDGGGLAFAIFCRLAYVVVVVYPAQPKSCTVHRNSHARTWNLSFSFACIFTLITRKAVRLFGILSIEHIRNTIN